MVGFESSFFASAIQLLFTAPKLMVILALVFFLVGVPLMALLTILLRRKKEPD